MSFSDILAYIRPILIHVPLWHWGVFFILSLTLTLFLTIRKMCSTYGTLALVITLLVGLFLLDAAVLIRWLSSSRYSFGINLEMEYNRLLHGEEARRIEMLCNVALFVPFGFFLSVFLSETNKYSVRRRVGIVLLISFCFSLCVECLQLLLRVGWFEITDLVLNTIGAFIGSGVALMVRAVFGISTNN